MAVQVIMKTVFILIINWLRITLKWYYLHVKITTRFHEKCVSDNIDDTRISSSPVIHISRPMIMKSLPYEKGPIAIDSASV